MKETSQPHLCDVCGLNTGEVQPSGIAPLSYTRCEICFEAGAELLSVICFKLYLDEGGPELAEKGKLSDWWKTVRSYRDGAYIGWAEISEVYPMFKAEFEEEED